MRLILNPRTPVRKDRALTTIDLLALPFDQYQRYTAVSQIADQVREDLAKPRLQVLDVGGFFRTRTGESILPASHFLLQDRVVAVDLVAERLPSYALAQGQALPFGDKAFDLVITCDTLEHIPLQSRPAFVNELLRVASGYLVLIAPFDSAATRFAERILYEHIIAQGYQHDALREHLENGLPDANDLRASLAKRNLNFVDLADGYLHHWMMMMMIKNTVGPSLGFHQDLERYYNLSFASEDRREPAYRRIFVVAQPGYDSLLPAIADGFYPAETPSPSIAFGFLTGLFSVLNQSQTAALAKAQYESQAQQGKTQAKLAVLEMEKGQLLKSMADLEMENTQLGELVSGYEDGRFIRFMSWLHQWRTKLGPK